jgi:hypothetical protein
MVRPIIIGSLVAHNPFLSDNPGRLVAFLIAFLHWHSLFIPRLFIRNL